MKQFVFAVEVLIKDDQELILVRDPRTGQIAKICNQPDELATFLKETINSFKTSVSDDKK